MELMNQPLTGQLGSRLIELLKVPDYHTLNIVVAFAKNSGVLRIKDSLESFRERGGIVNVYVGVDLGGTSYEALTALLLHTDSLNVVHSEKSQTFHSKIYQFLGKEEGLVVVGSHNLTAGGLWTNLWFYGFSVQKRQSALEASLAVASRGVLLFPDR
jgi:HKD family nuclease